MCEPSLDEIIAGCKKGERRYQKLLYEKYYNTFFGIALRYYMDKDKAASISNEGFLRVFNKIKKFSEQGSFEGWMKRLMKNLILDDIRRERKISYIDNIEDKIIEKVTNSNIDIEMQTRDVVQLLKELPEMERIVFNLFVLEGYSHKDISEALSVKINRSRMLLFQAKNKLKVICRKENYVKIYLN